MVSVVKSSHQSSMSRLLHSYFRLALCHESTFYIRPPPVFTDLTNHGLRGCRICASLFIRHVKLTRPNDAGSLVLWGGSQSRMSRLLMYHTRIIGVGPVVGMNDTMRLSPTSCLLNKCLIMSSSSLNVSAATRSCLIPRLAQCLYTCLPPIASVPTRS